jgi:predicted nucleotidyltransferase
MRDIRQLQLSPRHLAMLRALLSQQAPEAEAWAYGSRVNGGAHEGSDLDIVLRNPADPKAEIKHWLDVQEAVQESDLPMLVDVHDWAHLPTEFHRNIEQSYVVIREASSPERGHGG